MAEQSHIGHFAVPSWAVPVIAVCAAAASAYSVFTTHQADEIDELVRRVEILETQDTKVDERIREVELKLKGIEVQLGYIDSHMLTIIEDLSVIKDRLPTP